MRVDGTFLERHAGRLNEPEVTTPSRTMEILVGYDWSGNVRELQNIVERIVVVSSDTTLAIAGSWLSDDVPLPGPHEEPRHQQIRIQFGLAVDLTRLSPRLDRGAASPAS